MFGRASMASPQLVMLASPRIYFRRQHKETGPPQSNQKLQTYLNLRLADIFTTTRHSLHLNCLNQPDNMARGIELTPVRTRNASTSTDEVDHRLEHLLKLNHKDNGVLFSHYRFHNHVPHVSPVLHALRGAVAGLQLYRISLIEL